MGKHSKVSSSPKWELKESVVLRLMECLTPSVSFDISFCLLTHFGVNNIRGHGNALSLGTNSSKKNKKVHDHFEQRTSNKKEL